MRRAIGLGFIAAALASPAAAKPPSELERYYLGDYAVSIVEGDRPTACRVRILWTDDVGGEFETAGCAAWPDLAEATRWSFDPDAGNARFYDALRHPRFRLAETDAGFIAILRDDTHLWLELAPKPKSRKRH